MCYSAILKQNVHALARELQATPDLAAYASLFRRRLEGEKLLIGKGMEESFLTDSKNEIERSIANDIQRWHEQKQAEALAELKFQSERLAKAQHTLAAKPTKKAANDARIASGKIEKLEYEMARHKDLKKTSPSDSRIFPLHYFTMLTVNSQHQRILLPVRYLMRPEHKAADFDVKFNGCYNARLDSLQRVQWWNSVLGRRHGIAVIEKFFENVPKNLYQKNFPVPQNHQESANLVISYKPGTSSSVYVPFLWDIWEKQGEPTLISAALITDHPEPEVQVTGHDRTPIALKSSAIDAWLNATGNSTDEILDILNQREHPVYSHQIT